MIDINELNRVIARSSEFEAELASIFESVTFPSDSKSQVIITTYEIAQEHAIALRELIKHRLLTSGMAMLRLQFEAVVKELWVLYIASDTFINKLIAPLTLESEQVASNSLPTCKVMLSEIERKGPVGLHRHLGTFKDQSWRALNSFVHSGIHAISRHRNGYPAQLFINVVRQSNNLTHLSAVGLASYSQDQELALHVAMLFKKFGDCLQLDDSEAK